MKKYVKKYIKKYVKKYVKKNFKKYMKYMKHREELSKKYLLLKELVLNNKYKNFEACSFDELQKGDIVKSLTMTYSQKYFFREGCEEYNMVKHGILLHKNLNSPEDSIILQYNPAIDKLVKTNLYRNPGTSGEYSLQKYFSF
jgi:hypothetical protein